MRFILHMPYRALWSRAIVEVERVVAKLYPELSELDPLGFEVEGEDGERSRDGRIRETAWRIRLSRRGCGCGAEHRELVRAWRVVDLNMGEFSAYGQDTAAIP